MFWATGRRGYLAYNGSEPILISVEVVSRVWLYQNYNESGGVDVAETAILSFVCDEGRLTRYTRQLKLTAATQALAAVTLQG